MQLSALEKGDAGSRNGGPSKSREDSRGQGFVGVLSKIRCPAVPVIVNRKRRYASGTRVASGCQTADLEVLYDVQACAVRSCSLLIDPSPVSLLLPPYP